MLRTENMLGALISYQSFFVNGSTLRAGKETKENAARQSPSREKPQNPRIRSGSHRRRAASSRRANDALDASLTANDSIASTPFPASTLARAATPTASARTRSAAPRQALLSSKRSVPSRRRPVAVPSLSRRVASRHTYAFFLPPFLPLDMRLFLPTAILRDFPLRWSARGS